MQLGKFILEELQKIALQNRREDKCQYALISNPIQRLIEIDPTLTHDQVRDELNQLHRNGLIAGLCGGDSTVFDVKISLE